MGRQPSIGEAEQSRYARMAVRLNQARPSHVWTPFEKNGRQIAPGCSKCPNGSLFQRDRASHLYIIEEEPW